MLALGVFQGLLNAIGWVLAQIYDLVGNYGLSIIVLTIVIKVVLLPLGVKQIKSMQAMQSIQPKVKELQKKFKGNKAKIQEETMKLYKEAGVNPLGGCLPLLLQFPILIAMYAVIRAPQLQPADATGQPVPSTVEVKGQPVPNPDLATYLVHNSHLPEDSALFKNVVLHQNLDFLGMNLQCAAAQSGTQATISDSSRTPVQPDTPILYSDGTALPFQATTGDGKLPCGSKTVDKIPYFALLLFMVATTFYQQRQMQQASPPGAASGQQQAILKLMPLMFGIFGFTFPAGLTLYWTVSNLWQIGQQYVLLRAGHIGPDAMERRIAENRAKSANNPEPAKLGFMARMQQRAEQSQQARSGQSPKKPPPKKPTGGQKPKPPGGSPSTSGKGPQPKGRRPNTGGTPKTGRRPNTDPRKRGGGSDGAGDGEAGS
ncbi:MAG: YidC/Oxa1 family membrane protein insertase [Actinomycetota bacterium]